MTKIITKDSIEEAAQAIANGGLVAFSTETVYGLGADAFNEEAVKGIFKAKGRPGDNPLIVHIAKPQDVYDLAENVSDTAKILMDTFWPGPLTIIFNKKSTVPALVTAGLNTVAVRCPSNYTASKLIELSSKYIAAPSANLSGSPSPTTAKHVKDDLFGKIDYIIDSDECIIGLESTVIDISSGVPKILRPGAVTLEMLKELFPDATSESNFEENTDKPKCPGMKYKHYSPKAFVEVVIGNSDSVKSYISSKVESESGVGVLTYKTEGYKGAVLELSAGNNMEEYAKNLFTYLRMFDEHSVKKVYAEFCDEDGIGVAVKNRLYKAAGNNITRV